MGDTIVESEKKLCEMIQSKGESVDRFLHHFFLLLADQIVDFFSVFLVHSFLTHGFRFLMYLVVFVS